MRYRIAAILAATFALLIANAALAKTLRIGAQMTGTFGWELALIKARGLDKAAGLDLQVVDLANTEAGKIAIAGGAVDIILSDWLWVSRERALGRKLTFSPYSSALGALMAKSDGPVTKLADLEGKTIGVAGGPLDKSWLLLRAFAAKNGLDVAKAASVVYAAPPLLAMKARQGELDVTLQFWNFCVDLEQSGFRRVLELSDVEKGLGAKGPVAIVGYVFDEDFANANAETIGKFLAVARQAKYALASDSALWPDIMARIGQRGPDAAALYRQRYADGVPRRPILDEEADARVLFHTLAAIGGADLVGPASELDPGTFYKPKGGS